MENKNLDEGEASRGELFSKRGEARDENSSQFRPLVVLIGVSVGVNGFGCALVCGNGCGLGFAFNLQSPSPIYPHTHPSITATHRFIPHTAVISERRAVYETENQHDTEYNVYQQAHRGVESLQIPRYRIPRF